jgi:hypothetical protein
VGHTLSVDRLLNTYLVPRDHPAPDKVRRELDEVVRKHVTDSLGRALSSLLDPQDPSVWVIDTIAMDVFMDLSAAAPEETAAFWARKMAESVVRVITRGEDGDRVMRFANRAEYLAYFLRDLGAGSAWSKWHYRQFESLRSLPLGATIREALLREPEQAEPALLYLARTGGIAAVSRLLSQLDQERLLQLVSPQEASPGKKCFEATLQQWAAAPAGAPRALDLYLKVRLAVPEAPAAEARAAVQHVLCFARWEQKSKLKEIVTAAAMGRVSRLLQSLLPPEQDTALYLGFLANQDSELPLRLAAIARARHPLAWAGAAPQQPEAESSVGLVSPWAGVFLLLPALMADAELMTAYGETGDAISRYLLLGATMRVRAEESQYDAALAAAAGLDYPPELVALAANLAQARPTMDQDALRQNLLPQDLEQVDGASSHCWPDIALDESLRRDLALDAAVLLRNFARQLPGLGKSSFQYLWQNILSGRGVIRREPGQVVVELAPRPLEIVLRMAGFNHMRFTPPWMTSKPTPKETDAETQTEVIIRFTPQ